MFFNLYQPSKLSIFQPHFSYIIYSLSVKLFFLQIRTLKEEDAVVHISDTQGRVLSYI